MKPLRESKGSLSIGAAILALSLACAPSGRGSEAQSRAPAASPPKPEPAQASSPSPSPPMTEILFSYPSVSAHHIPVWIAKDEGIFEKYGLEVEVQVMTGQAGAQTLASRSSQVGTQGESAVNAFLQGARDLVVVMGLNHKANWKIMSQPEYTSIEQLRGKTVSGTSASTASTLSFREVLKRNSLDPDRDVNWSYLNSTPAIGTALVQKNIDAGTSASPTSLLLMRQGLKVLADTVDYDIDMLVSDLWTTRTYLAENRDVVLRVMKAIVEATSLSRQQPEKGIAAVMKWAKIEDREVAEDAYADATRIWDPRPPIKAVEAALQRSSHEAARTMTPKDLVDDNLYRELERTGFIRANPRAFPTGSP